MPDIGDLVRFRTTDGFNNRYGAVDRVLSSGGIDVTTVSLYNDGILDYGVTFGFDEYTVLTCDLSRSKAIASLAGAGSGVIWN